jgi:hypothetical protein
MPIFFAEFFAENILKIITSVPEQSGGQLQAEVSKSSTAESKQD